MSKAFRIYYEMNGRKETVVIRRDSAEEAWDAFEALCPSARPYGIELDAFKAQPVACTALVLRPEPWAVEDPVLDTAIFIVDMARYREELAAEEAARS